MCIGALIGGGIDFAVQMVSNGGDVSQVNWAQVGVSAVVGATGVGLGGVIANATKSVAINIGLNAAASSAVSFIGAEVQNRAQEALTPGKFERVDSLRAGATGLLTGGVGAAIVEIAQVGVKGFSNFRDSHLTLPQKLIQDSSSFIRDPKARSIYQDLYRAGFLVRLYPSGRITPHRQARQ